MWRICIYARLSRTVRSSRSSTISLGSAATSSSGISRNPSRSIPRTVAWQFRKNLGWASNSTRTRFGATLASCPTNSWPKTRRESVSCCVTNPRQVFNLAVVRVLPDADFASFPTEIDILVIVTVSAFPQAKVFPRINGTGHYFIFE